MTEGRPITVLVVDDHDVVHWGFRVLLGRQPWVTDCRVAGTDGGRQLFPSRQERELARTATLARATLTAARRSSQ